MRRIESNDWWDQLVELKDELSLRELADRFGVTPGAVSAGLKRGGHTRKSAPPGPRARRNTALPPEPGEKPSKAKRAGRKAVVKKATSTKKVASKKAPAAPKKKTAAPKRAVAVKKTPTAKKVTTPKKAPAAKKTAVAKKTAPAKRPAPAKKGGRSASASVQKAVAKASGKAPPKMAPAKEAPVKKTVAKSGVRPGTKDVKLLPFVSLMGKCPDGDIAKKVGVSTRTVASYRNRNGIDGYSGPRKKGADRKPRRSRIDPFQHLLGTVPDRVVAEQANVSLNAIRNYRVKKGIAANGRGRPRLGSIPSAAQLAAPPVKTASVAAKATPARVSARRSPDGTVAWRVELASGETVVVAANSLAGAAVSAQSAGDVLSLHRIGRLV